MKNKNYRAKLIFSETGEGLKLKLRNRIFRLSYPKKIWKNYPGRQKEFLADNLSYLSTITFPLISGFKKIQYNTSYPLFKSYFQQMVVRDIPSSTEDYSFSTATTLKEFLNLEVCFKDNRSKSPSFPITPRASRVIIPLSFGKDSLLTLALARGIGLEPIGVYINDTVSGLENRWKLELAKKISRKFRMKIFVVNNQIEKINDFEYWRKDESSLGYSHMIAGFSFLSLPFAFFFKAKYIAFGNQQNMNFSFQNKEGYRALPSFDQSLEGMAALNTAINVATENKVSVISLIEPLTNLTITKILNCRYPDLAQFQISCDAINTLKKRQRWCLDCSKCARLYIFMKAWGIDTKKLGFTKELLGKNNEKLYRLFSGRDTDNYEKSKAARDEQLLAFYLAYKKGTKGYLIDKFAKKFLPEARRREKTLRKDFLKPYSMESIPENLKTKLRRIYSKELSGKFIFDD